MQENTNKSRYFGSKIVINPRKLNKTHIDIYSTTNIQQYYSELYCSID